MSPYIVVTLALIIPTIFFRLGDLFTVTPAGPEPETLKCVYWQNLAQPAKSMELEFCLLLEITNSHMEFLLGLMKTCLHQDITPRHCQVLP